MAISSLFSCFLPTSSLSKSELKKIENMDIKSIRNTDINRMINSFSRKPKTRKELEQQKIVISIMNKIGQYNECGEHILSKYQPDKIIDLRVNQVVDNAFSSIMKDKNNPLTSPTKEEIKQHFACYGVSLIETKLTREEINSQQAKNHIKSFLRWIGVDKACVGRSGLQATLISAVDKAKLDQCQASVNLRVSVTTQINKLVESKINEHLSNYAKNKYGCTTILTKGSIDSWVLNNIGLF
ncbi:hypothetical protein NMR54_003294 [Vibrio cholerae]|uniref:hypothetical protein n=1 Tax=Vibrio cholerae TaxID=666 RepID=UPI001159153B|nr:hypothetical protein [Vibrio cholerae]EGQ9206871.1 hypothetical protein [Vibrio cholerae]EGQ9333953.1 hypothetical protein [Vibrio cholerae]EIA3093054.1 hypothetical protein [Vibrio cholerae]EJL6321846.1 hypothetical protein [Vibrio cholerae]EJL6706367.1 hypothetical protein [Vibrio cholerae]